jgi:hypothetical protein
MAANPNALESEQVTIADRFLGEDEIPWGARGKGSAGAGYWCLGCRWLGEPLSDFSE